MAVDAPSLVELIISCGLGGAALKIVELLVRKFTGRRAETVSEAERLNAISLSLLTPIHDELRSARQEATDLRVEISEMRGEFEALMEWARQAKVELDHRGVTIPPIPLHRIK